MINHNNVIGLNIIQGNTFMSVATSYNNDTWIAPVYYPTDKDNNIYFVSSLSLNIYYIINKFHIKFTTFKSLIFIFKDYF